MLLSPGYTRFIQHQQHLSNTLILMSGQLHVILNFIS